MLNEKAMLSGARIGLLLGFLIGFFQAERIKGIFQGQSANTIRSQLDNLMADPVAQGLEEGKAAARRHLR